MDRYSCTLQGACAPDAEGNFTTPNCDGRCGGQEGSDALYTVFEYEPSAAVALAPQDRVEVVARLTQYQVPASSEDEEATTHSITVAPEDSTAILLALADNNVEALAHYPALYPWLEQTTLPETYNEALQEVSSIESLQELQRVGGVIGFNVFDIVLRRRDRRTLQWLLEHELIPPYLDIDSQVYEAMLNDEEFSLWMIEQEPEWFLGLQDTIHYILTRPQYRRLLQRLYRLKILSEDAVDTAAYGGNLEAVQMLMERGSKPPSMWMSVIGENRPVIELALQYYQGSSEDNSLDRIAERLIKYRDLLRQFLAKVPNYRVQGWMVRGLAITERVPELVARFDRNTLEMSISRNLLQREDLEFILRNIDPLLLDESLNIVVRPSDLLYEITSVSSPRRNSI